MAIPLSLEIPKRGYVPAKALKIAGAQRSVY